MRLATVSVVCTSNEETTRKTFEFLEKNTDQDKVDFVFTVNGNNPAMRDLVLNYSFKHKAVILYEDVRSHMFTHNRVLDMTHTEYFVIMDNDFYVKDNQWLEKSIEVCKKDELIALVGAKENPSQIKESGHGCWGKNVEYIEGSFTVGPTQTLKRLGLYDECYVVAFYDDSDTSLRYRQAGLKIDVVDFSFEHVRGGDSTKVPSDFMKASLAHNDRIYRARWQNYFTKRTFNNHIVIETGETNLDRQIYIKSAIQKLHPTHPTCTFFIPQILADVCMHDKTMVGKNVEFYADYAGPEPDRVINFDVPVEGEPEPYELKCLYRAAII
jgi:GT2 family glycosyltransferase